MNVMIVSQCSKKALTESRRILDQFAVRHGDRTWLTPITAQGLDALHRLLRSTARRNTAVACHWVRSPGITELLWVVGNARQFGPEGEVPTNTTERKVVRANDENNWHSATTIELLAAMAALFHDFGKANIWFQGKLKKTAEGHETYRHEWVSLRLFQAFVGHSSDAQWLERLTAWSQEPSAESLTSWLNQLVCDGVGASTTPPLSTLPPIAKAVGWLVVSHHLLPTKKELPNNLENLLASVSADCGYTRPQEAQESLPTSHLAKSKSKGKKMTPADCWDFGGPEGGNLPTQSAVWRKRAAKLASRMLACPALFVQPAEGAPPFDAYVLHLSRLSLMLADRYYSSQAADPRLGDATFSAYANTEWVDDVNAPSRLKQKLDEHLIGVEKAAHGIVRALPAMEQSLPGLGPHKLFRKRSADKRFQWQDKACDQLGAWVEPANSQGFFGVNMASTGLGKTLGNAKIMAALADPVRGPRFTVALGLRTLTLQTGQALRERLHLNDSQMAVLVGSDAVRQMFDALQAENKLEKKRAQETTATSVWANAQATGSESMQSTQQAEEEESSLDYAITDVETPLDRWLPTEYQSNSKARRLLHAPALVCTIDHLMPACESTRGGHQIVPMLRLLSTDLVLDEPDDFGIEDCYALSRLVYFAGLLGSKVLLSSATLPPALVQGLYAAYAAGRAVYQVNRGSSHAPTPIVCAWVDENAVRIATHATESGFMQTHQTFVAHRIAYLEEQQKTQGRRMAVIEKVGLPTIENDHEGRRRQTRLLMAKGIFRQAVNLHKRQANHYQDSVSGKWISFGLVRMANIDPLIDVARVAFGAFKENGKSSFPTDCHIHLCAYHSRFPLLLRSAIENRLDKWLQRHRQAKDFPPVFLEDPDFQALLAQSNAKHHIFVVLATAVAEVGRDHDYDWAVVEPSSMRSIIQLAGRIRRHRPGIVTEPNMVLLNSNCRHLENPDAVAFTKPGFEDKARRLQSHQLTDLLRESELKAIHAGARIQQAEPLEPTRYLADLEHQRLHELLVNNADSNMPSARRFWEQATHLTGTEQRRSSFRCDPLGRETLVLSPHDNGEPIGFCIFNPDGKRVEKTQYAKVLSPVPTDPRITPWGHDGYELELERWGERSGIDDPIKCAKRFACVDLPQSGSALGWEYEETLGIRRSKN